MHLKAGPKIKITKRFLRLSHILFVLTNHSKSLVLRKQFHILFVQVCQSSSVDCFSLSDKYLASYNAQKLSLWHIDKNKLQ